MLTHPRALKTVRDNSMTLYYRVSVQGYKECQGDILAVSEMAEDIQDALLEYQVSGGKSHTAEVVALKLWQTNRQRAIYSQNCRLIVSCRACMLGTCLMSVVVSRILVRSSHLLPPK